MLRSKRSLSVAVLGVSGLLEACEAPPPPALSGPSEESGDDEWGSEGEPECDPGPCYSHHSLPGPGYTFALGDFDGDATQDVALGDGPGPDGSPHAARLLFGDGADGFHSDRTLQFLPPCGHARQLIRVPRTPADALVWARDCGETPMVVESWTEGPSFVQIATVDGSFAGLLAGRFDDDAEFDLAIAGRFAGTDAPLSVLLADGSGGFRSHAWTGVAIAQPRASASADLDADDDDDVVIVDDQAVLHVLLADGTGAFVPGSNDLALGEQPLGVLLGEVTGDPRIDLVTMAEGGAWRHAGAGDGTFGEAQALLDDDTSVTGLWLGDLDEDGTGDVLIGSPGVPARVLALAHGERELELEVPNPPVALAAGDFGADGVPDIVYTDGDRAYVLLSF